MHLATLFLFVLGTAALPAVPVSLDGSQEMTTKTFLSPAVNLKSGQIANTPLQTFGPLEWVPGPVAMKLFKAQVVDDSGAAVPLSEVYVHHWLIYDSTGGANLGECAPLPETFGIGAEGRNTWYEFPGAYAVTTTGKEKWTANLHFIRTTNVVDVQSCIECICPDSQPPLNPHGNVGCCPDQSQCFGMENSTLADAKNYYLQYTIGYVPITEDIIPLSVLTFDVTASATYDCHVSYDIPELADNEIHNLTTFATVPMDYEAVVLEVHQHIGGVNFTVDHYRGGVRLGQMCSQAPIYGSGGVDTPGNETGYLVQIPECIYDKPFQLKAGDQLRLESIYSNRHLPGGHGWHAGVMGLVFLFGVPHQNHTMMCEQKFFSLCGPPPYISQFDCDQCRTDTFVVNYMASFGCNVSDLEPECKRIAPPGTIPTPEGVANMTLNYLHTGGSSYSLNLTGPSDRWFGIAFNRDNNIMDGAMAWIASAGSSGTQIFQRRTLGNHNEGNVTYPSYPCDVQTSGGFASVLFTADLDLTGSHNCVLFAHADSPDWTLGYHGSSRGMTCLKPGGVPGKSHFLLPPH